MGYYRHIACALALSVAFYTRGQTESDSHYLANIASDVSYIAGYIDNIYGSNENQEYLLSGIDSNLQTIQSDVEVLISLLRDIDSDSSLKETHLQYIRSYISNIDDNTRPLRQQLDTLLARLGHGSPTNQTVFGLMGETKDAIRPRNSTNTVVGLLENIDAKISAIPSSNGIQTNFWFYMATPGNEVVTNEWLEAGSINARVKRWPLQYYAGFGLQSRYFWSWPYGDLYDEEDNFYAPELDKSIWLPETDRIVHLSTYLHSIREGSEENEYLEANYSTEDWQAAYTFAMRQMFGTYDMTKFIENIAYSNASWAEAWVDVEDRKSERWNELISGMNSVNKSLGDGLGFLETIASNTTPYQVAESSMPTNKPEFITPTNMVGVIPEVQTISEYMANSSDEQKYDTWISPLSDNFTAVTDFFSALGNGGRLIFDLSPTFKGTRLEHSFDFGQASNYETNSQVRNAGKWICAILEWVFYCAFGFYLVYEVLSIGAKENAPTEIPF